MQLKVRGPILREGRENGCGKNLQSRTDVKHLAQSLTSSERSVDGNNHHATDPRPDASVSRLPHASAP